MDENLVVPALQFADQTGFDNRYRRFDTAEKRDDHFKWLATATYPENMKMISRVNLIIRVETLSEGEN